MKQLNDKRHIYYFMCEYNGIRIRCSYFVSPTEVLCLHIEFTTFYRLCQLSLGLRRLREL